MTERDVINNRGRKIRIVFLMDNGDTKEVTGVVEYSDSIDYYHFGSKEGSKAHRNLLLKTSEYDSTLIMWDQLEKVLKWERIE